MASTRHRLRKAAMLFSVSKTARSEVIFDARRDTLQMAACPAMGVGTYAATRCWGAIRVMTVRGDTPATGAEIVVGGWTVDRCGIIDVPHQPGFDRMLVSGGEHIRLIV